MAVITGAGDVPFDTRYFTFSVIGFLSYLIKSSTNYSGLNEGDDYWRSYTGTNFTYNSLDKFAGGTVTRYREAPDPVAVPYFGSTTITGLSIAAASITASSGTATTSDDLALVRAALAGNDLFTGATGNDFVAAAGGADRLHGNGGRDTLLGEIGNDTLAGGADDDVLFGGPGNDVLIGGAGADLLFGGVNNDTYALGDGSDVVSDSGGIDRITSTITRTLVSHPAVEGLTLLGSADISGTGNNLANTVVGNSGANTLAGGFGNDTLIGGSGIDTLHGEAGNDAYVLDNGFDLVVDTGGVDIVISTITRSLLAPGLDTIENLTLQGGNLNGTGNSLANLLSGSIGNNVLSGGLGNDTLRGFNGTDALYGGVGHDTLAGDAGIDTLSGGSDNDFFLFRVSVVAANRDVVTDFANLVGNNDTIQLENAVFTRLGAPRVLASTAFKLSGQAMDADDRIIYNQALGALFYDLDGSGAVAPVQFATLLTRPTLTYADFVVV